jgi:hypothetical protein
MHEHTFQKHIHAYETWKTTLSQGIEQFQTWLDEQHLGTPHDSLPLYEALQALRADRLTIAFMGEFSRGKSELINAIFFADQGRRLLPTDAGRTTMCPTELLHDPQASGAYIRLLPIETRASATSIADHKLQPLHWNSLPLNLQSPDQMACALREVLRVKQVSVDEAKRLGLYNDETVLLPTGLVEIPHWRHALINFPHPLLKQGLVVLDTPGLNALGSEPELTLQMLPAAQAVLFVLGADTGVTRSDLVMWRQLFKGQRQRQCGMLVALNKIDTLWDELTDPAITTAAITAQQRSCAEQLGIDSACVFPVSAQKALVAKVRGDAPLLAHSRLPELERYLGEEIIPARQQIVHETVLTTVDARSQAVRDLLNGRVQQLDRHGDELRALRGQSADAVLQLMTETRTEQTHYLKSVENFQTSRNLVNGQGKLLLDTLSPTALDQLSAHTRQSMVESWTTLGLKHAMANFFEATRTNLQEALSHAEQLQRVVQNSYRRFHEEHSLTQLHPQTLALHRYFIDLEELYQDAEEFRGSTLTTMTEQGFVIEKFFATLVHEVREIFVRAYQTAQSWLGAALNPLQTQIREHQQMMEQRLETLRKISQSRDILELKLRELERQRLHLQGQLATLQSLRAALHQPPPQSQPDSAGNVTPLRAVG